MYNKNSFSSFKDYNMLFPMDKEYDSSNTFTRGGIRNRCEVILCAGWNRRHICIDVEYEKFGNPFNYDANLHIVIFELFHDNWKCLSKFKRRFYRNKKRIIKSFANDFIKSYFRRIRKNNKKMFKMIVKHREIRKYI